LNELNKWSVPRAAPDSQPMKKSLALSHLACLLLALHPGAGWAQSSAQPEARARQYFAEGTGYFRGGRYLDAEAAFAAGFELSHKPGFLWNMAECARLLGNRERALELYRRYVKEAPAGAQRGEADARILELEPVADRKGDNALDRTNVEWRGAAAPSASASAPASSSSSPQAPAPAILLEQKSPNANRIFEPTPAEASKPVYTRWWFWTGAAAVVAGAVVTAVVLSSSSSGSHDNPAPSGTTVDWRGR